MTTPESRPGARTTDTATSMFDARREIRYSEALFNESLPLRRAWTLTWEEQRRVSGKSSHAALPFRRVRACPTPSRISRMSWLVRRKGSAVCELAARCWRLFQSVKKTRMGVLFHASPEPGAPGRGRGAPMRGEQRRIPGKSRRAGLPFRRVRARPAPSRTAGCRGWCAEREAPYAGSLLDVADWFRARMEG